MLQSNLIYGVKAYFKIENQGEIYYKYIRPYILYTFPIYNDKYYSYKDFSELQPNLKLALTYKLTDESERKIYNDNSLNINELYIDKINNILVNDYCKLYEFLDLFFNNEKKLYLGNYKIDSK
jgi:hypothetical protein